jgi:hypothetical protein
MALCCLLSCSSLTYAAATVAAAVTAAVAAALLLLLTQLPKDGVFYNVTLHHQRFSTADECDALSWKAF